MKLYRGMPAAERFWARVDLGRYREDCWMWTGYCNDAGYGQMKFRGSNWFTHRIAYTLRYGEIPVGEGWHGTVIRHTCDNPGCCNPDHLIAGTQKENMVEAAARKRIASGEESHSSKLTDEQALAIYYDKRIYREIAEDYGIVSHTVWSIKKKRTWKHIHEEVPA